MVGMRGRVVGCFVQESVKANFLEMRVRAFIIPTLPRVGSRVVDAGWPNGLRSCIRRCRVRNPACTATSAPGKERYING